MPDEKGNVTLEITLPQEIYDRVKRLAEDGVQDLFPMPTNRQPTTAEDFVADLLIGRLRAFGITADSAEVQTLKTELTAKQVELEMALEPRIVGQKAADVVAAAGDGSKQRRPKLARLPFGRITEEQSALVLVVCKEAVIPVEECSTNLRTWRVSHVAKAERKVGVFAGCLSTIIRFRRVRDSDARSHRPQKSVQTSFGSEGHPGRPAGSSRSG